MDPDSCTGCHENSDPAENSDPVADSNPENSDPSKLKKKKKDEKKNEKKKYKRRLNPLHQKCFMVTQCSKATAVDLIYSLVHYCRT